MEKIYNRTEKKAFEIIEKIKSFFGNKVDNIRIKGEIYLNPESFEIEFEAYKYFSVYFCYDCGFCFSIKSGDYYISLLGCQKDYESDNFDKFLEEFQKELELRIPDKFLTKYGWK